ncbi:hypothetical protein LTR62_005769 [Meristemomyces frigidus]|uniref:Uncharacterized protein n=1 Tax=Meristemomyces frigidus TaxID=1508187 RepID=A0AAN7TGN4_9PEZI|nr:hypothetical protein LTR62_005769 [Meristemomyces frigidus]
MQSITLLLTLFGLASSALPTNSLLPKDAHCENDCNDTTAYCTPSGTFASSSDLQKMVNDYCAVHVGTTVHAGTTQSATYSLKDGINSFLAIRNYGTGVWVFDQNVCSWGFGGVLTGCENSVDASQGGYAQMAGKDLTFVIGIDGNESILGDLCNVQKLNWC